MQWGAPKALSEPAACLSAFWWVQTTRKQEYVNMSMAMKESSSGYKTPCVQNTKALTPFTELLIFQAKPAHAPKASTCVQQASFAEAPMAKKRRTST